MAQSSTKEIYERFRGELANLIARKAEIEKRIIAVRQTLEGLSVLCESEGVEIEPSSEAQYLLETSRLPDEILGILRATYPGYHRATVIKQKLEQLGHDMGKYQNPLATIHMVLKRLVEADKVETGTNKDQEKLYRAAPISDAALGKAMLGEYKPRRQWRSLEDRKWQSLEDQKKKKK